MVLCRVLEWGVHLHEVDWEGCFGEVTYKLDRIRQGEGVTGIQDKS